MYDGGDHIPDYRLSAAIPIVFCDIVHSGYFPHYHWRLPYVFTGGSLSVKHIWEMVYGHFCSYDGPFYVPTAPAYPGICIVAFLHDYHGFICIQHL